MKRAILTILITTLGILACFSPALAGSSSGTAAENPAVQAVSADPNAQPNIVIPEPLFSFDAVVDGTEVVHDFQVLNRGTGELAIQKVQTG